MSILLEEDEDIRYLSVSDITECYGVRKSYVYKLACIHNWRRIKEGSRVRYHIDDIDAVLGQDV